MSQILKEESYKNKRKSKLIAYILLFIFGFIGGHRFYVGKFVSGFIMLIFAFIAIFLTLNGAEDLGNIFSIIPAIWSFVDIFLIPGMIRTYNVDLALKLGLNNIPS